MTTQVLVAGGGIGGLAAALATSRAGALVRLYEQAAVFSEVGAGIQLGPNATRILAAWGLDQSLAECAAVPEHLQVNHASDGAELARLPLGRDMVARYGAPYLCIHRADLHGTLLQAVRQHGCQLHLNSPVLSVAQTAHAVTIQTPDWPQVEADVLVGADGLWSRTREQVFAGAAPRASGHLAYRALVRQHDLPQGLRQSAVRVWLGPRMHLVAYPVRAGELLNVVAIVHGQTQGDERDWDQAALVADLQSAMGPVCTHLSDLVCAMPQWRLWALHDRAPVSGVDEMVRGRVALLGDAAHPMRPYLAQGAGMAIEDAASLAQVLSLAGSVQLDLPLALRRYGLNRWPRCAKVQAKARRNGQIFHASGPLQWGRDAALRVLGARLLDQPWLYGA